MAFMGLEGVAKGSGVSWGVGVLGGIGVAVV